MNNYLKDWVHLYNESPHQCAIVRKNMDWEASNFYFSIEKILHRKFDEAIEVLHPLLILYPQSEVIHAYWRLCWVKPSNLDFLFEDDFYTLFSQINADAFRKHLQYNTSNLGKINMQHSNKNTAEIAQNFYGQVLLTPHTLANIATSKETWSELLMFHKHLATDMYVSYLDKYYRKSIELYGSNWNYFDITNVVYAASKTSAPARYLEIGVRRGRTLCCAVEATPNVDIYAFDMWMQNYAGMENPGPNFVEQELKRHGHTGQIHFFNGNSHETLPKFFAANPGLKFDMITVDGDHTEQGAYQDLEDVIPHLAIGGVLIFDDINHPQHQYLLKVWKAVMGNHPELSDFCYTEAGYGVAFAIKMR